MPRKRNTEKCSFVGCLRDYHSKGLCKTHYGQQHKGKELTPLDTPPRVCDVPDCGRKHKGHGLCNAHWMQKRSGKDLTSIKETNPRRPQNEVLQRDDQGRKYCITCSNWKSEEEFFSHRGQVDRLQTRCKRCARSRILEANFGITLESVESLLISQGGCAICKTDSSGYRDWCVDHDHSCCPELPTCGRCVRGILCSGCNLGLGCFKDSISSLSEAIHYLNAHDGGQNEIQNLLLWSGYPRVGSDLPVARDI